MNSKPLKENSIHGNPLFPLHVYCHNYTTGKFSVSYHWHEEIELIYIEQGEFLITVNGINIIATPGEIYFINIGELHQIQQSKNEPSIHYAIVFSPELLSFDLYDYCQSYYINPILNETLKFPTTLGADANLNKKIVGEFIDAVSSYRNKPLGWPLTVKSSLFKIISILIENDKLLSGTNLSNDNNYKIKLSKNLINYIHNNYKHKITIQDLANEAHMNPQYFCRFFKSTFGKTAIEYINEYRIEKAAEILLSKDVKIMEVCFNVGFDNFSYFIKKFKEYKKCTPSKYKLYKA